MMAENLPLHLGKEALVLIGTAVFVVVAVRDAELVSARADVLLIGVGTPVEAGLC